MNTNTVSVECAHGMHSGCQYEDCACDCHIEDLFDDGPMELIDDLWDEADPQPPPR